MPTTQLTYGLEIEATQIDVSAAAALRESQIDWHHDGSLLSDSGVKLPKGIGGELVSPVLAASFTCGESGFNAVLTSDTANTDLVYQMCAAARKVNTTCGIHIHLGLPDDNGVSKWKPEHIRTFLAIGLMLEEKLFEVCPPSRAKSPHCRRIAEVYTQRDLGSFYPIGVVKPNKRENPKRYCWLNLIETKRVGNKPSRQFGAGPALGTIEIRMLGCTIRHGYVDAWVKLWLKVAGLVSSVPASLAMLQCGFSDYLQQEFEALQRCRNSCAGSELLSECISLAPSVDT